MMKLKKWVTGALFGLLMIFGVTLAVHAADDNYLTFTGTSRSFYLSTRYGNKSWDGTLEYSTDKTNWQTWDGTSISSTKNAPYVLYLRGNNLQVGSYSLINTDYYNSLKLSEPAACSGNIMTLLNYSNPSATITSGGAFANLFANCDKLTSAPELPATTLTDYCYYNMFRGCTSLTNAPELPATTLADNCYENMFRSFRKIIR